MFTKLLRRNLIMMMIPILVMEGLIIFMIMQLGLLSEYSSKRINNISGVDLLYEEGTKNISFISDACPEPVGFDEVRGEERIAGYYYLFEGDNIRLLVLSDETYDLLKSGKKVQINARLEKDEVKEKYIENAISERLGVDSSAFEDFVYPVIINETDFPFVKIFVTNNAAGVVFVLMIISVLYSVVAFVCPWLIFGFKKKGIAKSKSDVIDIINEELDEHLEEQDGNTYTTENYIIKMFVSHVDIIKR